MRNIGIVGHFGQGKDLADGQTIKTRMLEEELTRVLDDRVLTVDTYNWKRNPIVLLINCIRLIFRCKEVIIMPAHNGIKIFIPLFILLNLFFKRRIHYVVIGGWLPDLLSKNRRLIPFVKRLDSIHVESNTMIDNLGKLGIRKTFYMPNFKRLTPLTSEELVFDHQKPFKLCTFSRVMKEKGIEDAIEAVTQINMKYGKVVFTLDVYGAIDENYKERFFDVLDKSEEYILYKGIVAYDQSVEVLKSYFVLLFPTYYSGEGFAGTIIDSFASGVPILATNWKYNSEVINHGYSGLIYDVVLGKLYNQLDLILHKPELIMAMKLNCIQEYQKYNPELLTKQLIAVITE